MAIKTLRLAVTLALTATLLIPNATSSTETTMLSPDGVWWQSLSKNEKTVAIEGMLVGYQSGFDDASIAAGSVIVDPSSADQPVDQKSRQALGNLTKASHMSDHVWDAIVDAVNTQRRDFSGRTFGTMVDRLDEVYNAHPKLLKMQVSDFFLCAATSGLNCDRTARRYELRNAR